MVRRQIATELGIVIPRVRIHDELGMESHEYVIKIRGSEVTRGRIMPGHLLAMNPGDALGSLSGIPTREPAFGLEAVWVHESGRAEAESLGYTVVDPESVIVTHLTETIRSHAAELLSRQDVRALLDRLKETNAAVVDEVVPEMLSLGEIQRVLQSLLAEGVPIRDLGTIVEAIGDKARTTRDTSLLSEYARQALGRAITAPHLDEQLRLQAITLDPAIEQEVSTSITQTTDGEYLAMEPSRAPGDRDRAARAGRARDRARRAAGAAVLGAHPPPPAQADRAGPAAPRRVLLQRDRSRRRCRNGRGDPRVSTPGELLGALGREAKARLGNGRGSSSTRVYRGRTVEELIPRIERELGSDAIVVRRREGLTGGVLGFFQHPWVEIEACPGLPASTSTTRRRTSSRRSRRARLPPRRTPRALHPCPLPRALPPGR